jgi:hypothetical protein
MSGPSDDRANIMLQGPQLSRGPLAHWTTSDPLQPADLPAEARSPIQRTLLRWPPAGRSLFRPWLFDSLTIDWNRAGSIWLIPI